MFASAVDTFHLTFCINISVESVSSQICTLESTSLGSAKRSSSRYELVSQMCPESAKFLLLIVVSNVLFYCYSLHCANTLLSSDDIDLETSVLKKQTIYQWIIDRCKESLLFLRSSVTEKLYNVLKQQSFND